MALHVPAIVAEAMLLLQLIEDFETAADGGSGTGESLREDGAFGFESVAVQRRADLGDLPQRHDICVLIQSEVLECKGAAQATKRLDFVEDHQHVLFFAEFAEGFEVLVRAGVVATFTGDQFQPEASVLSRVAFEELVQASDGGLGGPFGIGRVEHGQVVHIQGFGNSLSVGGAIGEGGQSDRATGEAIVDADDARGGVSIVEGDFK